MKSGLFFASIVAGLALAGAAQAQAPHTEFEDGSRPEWTARPNHADAWNDMASAGLSRSDVGQWAVVVCTIGENRRLQDCEISRESTPQTDIGDALLRMSRRFRSASTGRDGQSTVGRRVYLSMGYGGTMVP